MRSKYYRLKRATLAILASEGDRKIPVTIPEGATVEALADLDRNQLVDVVWEGKTVLMFTIDLRNRGERCEPGRAIISR